MGDDTDNTKGAVATQTPDGKEGQTPQEPITLTKEEAEAQIAKAVNAVKTDVGRLTAELKRSQDIANAAITRLKEREEEDLRRQEEQYKDDPGELSRIRKERQSREREVKLAERETKVQTQLTRLLQINAKALASQYNVSEETLLKYAGDDAEKMEELATSYGEKETGESRTKSKRMTQEPDSGKTKGGGAGLTKEDIAKMSPEEINRRSKEIASIPF